MTILQLTTHLNAGGVTSHVLALSRELRARGHRVIIGADAGRFQEDLAQEGLANWRVPLQTSNEFSPQVYAAVRQLEWFMRREPVGLIHAHTRVSQVAAAWIARRAGLPYVATWHGFFRRNLGRLLWPCTGRLTIAISEPVRQHLLQEFRLPPSQVRLVPHGIDPAPFEAAADAGEAARLREELGLPPGAKVVGTIARLVASKGIDQLIRSLPEIRQREPAAHLMIVGDGEERRPLERLATQLGVAAEVHFAGTLPETRTALSLMDVFVFLPAHQEGFGLSLLEAMAGARPIVAVRRGVGAPWVLDHSGVGLVVEPGETSALAEAVGRYLQDGELACREAGRARAVVNERFSLRRMIDQTEAVYRELMTSH